MQKNFFHIVLSLLLTVAVTDYIWYDLLHDTQVAIELELDKEESKEELRENRLEESRHDFLEFSGFSTSKGFSFQTLSSGVMTHGNSFHPLSNDGGVKFPVLYCQLRLHC